MSRYKSRHTGATIDDAVDRATMYGLGATPKKITDWNDAKFSGWYYSDTGALNSPDSNMLFFGIVYNANNPDVFVQEVWHFPNVDRVFHWQRFYYPGTGNGTPWEWIDPPMYLGVEYRTTERYNGKPVYKVALETKSLLIPGTSSVAGTWDYSCTVINTQIGVIRPDGSCSTSPNFEDSTIYLRHWARAGGELAIKTFEGLPTGTTVKAVISYIRN